MTIRILHIVRALEVGGLEKVVLDLARGSAAKGIDCYLACLFEEGEWGSQSRGDGAWKGIWLGNAEHRSSIAVIRDLSRYAKKQGIDLIHTHNPQPHLFGVAASLLSRIPLVHTKHGRNYPDNSRRVWLNRQLTRFSKKIVAVSENVASVARDIERVPGEKIVVIRNGVEVSEYRSIGVSESGTPILPYSQTPTREQLRGQRGIPEDAFVVGTVGRLSPEKNYSLLIRAFARFKNSGKEELSSVICHLSSEREPCLLLVGDGPERKKLDSLIGELDIRDNVIMPGMQKDVGTWLSCMDVFCLSSLSEGTSITLLEASACGVPSIVTDVGGNSEVVSDGATGMVVPSGDADALAAAMQQLAGGCLQRTQMGISAQKKIESAYSANSMVSDYLGVYNSVVNTTLSHNT